MTIKQHLQQARVELARSTYYVGAAKALHVAAAQGHIKQAKRLMGRAK